MECLNLIGRLSHRAPSHDALLLLVTEFCNDIDPRVRREALNALVSTTSLSLTLTLSLSLSLSHNLCILYLSWR